VVFRPRKEVLLVSLVAAAACAVRALRVGEDINWDLLNYHIYDVFALFNDRSQLDIAPSQIQTWFNPFGEIIPYLLIMYTPPIIGSLVLGVISSVSVCVVYFIARATMAKNEGVSEAFHIIICSLVALAAFVTPSFLSGIGTSGIDSLGGIFILLSLLFVIKRRFTPQSYIFAGLMLGLALDIKLTNIIYVVGWVAAIIFLEKIRSLRPIIYSGLAALVTYLPIGGAWNLYIYFQFKNPLFPLYNNIFKSTAYNFGSMLDERFKPHSFADALSYFPKWILGEHPSSELYFTDIRFFLALILLTLVLPQIIFLFFEKDDDKDGALIPFAGVPSLFLLVFVVVSFTVWLLVYGIQRYIIVLEQLAVLVIFILLALLKGARGSLLPSAVMSVLVVLLVTRAPDFGRTSFNGSWFDIRVPEALSNEGRLFVMVSGEPMSFVIPFFALSDAFIRIEGNMPLDPAVGLGHEAFLRIQSHKGPIGTLGPVAALTETSLIHLKSFGLMPGDKACVEIGTKAGSLQSCPLIHDQ